MSSTMTASQFIADLPLALARTPDGAAQRLYRALFRAQPATASLNTASDYLHASLEEVADLPHDLPPTAADAPEILDWINDGVHSVGVQYRSYLEQRKNGAPRRYFSCKSHALHFLNAVAPTKMVDGAWLYGVTRFWRDQRFMPLIRTYLEELGDGQADKNHVGLYKKLLDSNECDNAGTLSDAHYVQGVLQLALAHHADEFLPELIGYNLGYEQLPLHLLITSYELNELGIDPYYFTLHVTVDNADTGHAKKAMEAVLGLMPQLDDADEFYRRLCNGYKLNNLGANTLAVIASFDLEKEVHAVFERKSVVGNMAHSDYCRVAGRTVNDWLSEPSQIPAFLAALEDAGWIKRNEAPENSRFWKLLQGEKAEMFGVFNAYELQLIHDWILGTAKPAQRPLSFRARQRLHKTLNADSVRALPARAAANDAHATDADVQRLQEQLADARAHGEPGEDVDLLIRMMSPTLHWTPAGLAATRTFVRMLAA